jgi:hypothetical protein
MFKYYKSVICYNGSSVYKKKQDSGWRRKPESIWEAVHIVRFEAEAEDPPHRNVL